MRCLYFSAKIMTYLSDKFLIDPLTLEYTRKTLNSHVDDYREEGNIIGLVSVSIQEKPSWHK